MMVCVYGSAPDRHHTDVVRVSATRSGAASCLLVGVVLINYCGYADTVECVASLRAQTYKRLRMYVVDGASPDGSGERLAGELDSDAEVVPCRVMRLEDNLGFSGANNAGIRAALDDGCDVVMLINNDTVAASDLVEHLVAALDEDTIVTPYIYYHAEPERLWCAGGYFNRWGVSKHYTEPPDSLDCEFACGCCLAMTRSAVERVGMWDERYFLYWEDSEYSVRARRKGLSIRVVPGAKLWHKVSASTGGGGSPMADYYLLRNKLLFAREAHLGVRPRLWAWVTVLRRCAAFGASGRIARMALSDYLHGRFGRRDSWCS